MSNNLVSKQFSMPSSQMGQLETISNKLDSSIQMGLMGPGINDPSSKQTLISDMQMGPMGSGVGGPALQQLSTSNMQIGLLDPMSNYLGSQILPISYQQTGHTEPQAYNPLTQPFLVQHNPSGGMGTMINDLSSQQLSSKRKAPMEPMPNSSASPKLSMPNKRMAQMEHRPWLQQLSAPNKRAVQIQSTSNSPRVQHLPTPSRKTVRVESITSKSGQQTTPKNQHAQMYLSPKAQNESFESVRSKMRESLAAALAMVSQQQGEPLNAAKNSQGKAAITPGKTEENSQPIGSTSGGSGVIAHVSEGTTQTFPSNDECSAQKCSDGQIASQETLTYGKTGDTTICDGQGSQSGNALPQEDVSFNDNIFAKDELLQGNGLSWVFDPETEVGEKKEIQTGETQKSDGEEEGGNTGEQSVQCPQLLARKIEVELFKLFGGVNKKYKEKGRSLLFNLKDRNNPELRERVMSGEISAERLCSMSAEELASKELSEWRQAKAEEMAQMVVLPDSEVDIRRLVRKTHKGEFQVEIEQVDSGSMEVSVGASSLTQIRPITKEAESPLPAKTVGKKDEPNDSSEKSNQQDQETSCTITIPSSDGTDLLQGLIVDDEMKDAEFLPPIVSLDEFMESLDSEPPFENLPVDAGKARPISEKNDSEVGSKSKSPEKTTRVGVDTALEKPDDTAASFSKSDDVKSSGSDVKSETMPPVAASMGEHVWEGLLQPSISATTSVIGIFRSGEKTSAREWPGFLEIKGRVRLDAFEKFLQELPMSRSRAVMVMHFVCKEGSPKSERGTLTEVADSYVVDGRVGFAEPASGVELYLCPPHAKTLEMLSKILPKDQLEAINTLDNGLIGVVVWRRAQLTISPNSTSHHKHNSKKQHSSSRRQQEKDTNMNVNFTSKPTVPQGGSSAHHRHPPEDDDDDVPPGFGPGAARDEDDLPEFNFLGGQFPAQTPSRGQGPVAFHLHPQTPSLAVDQMRELIHKYGQPKGIASPGRVGAALQPWNDDDDDDIPEWQPQAQQHQPPPQPSHPVHNLRAHMVNQVHSGLSQHQTMVRPATHLLPQQNLMQGQLQHLQQGAWWVPSSGPRAPLCQPNEGQYYGTPGLGGSQPGIVPKSRGF